MPRTMERRGSNHFRPKTPTSAMDDPTVRNKTGADDALDAENEELKAQVCPGCALPCPALPCRSRHHHH